MFCLCCWAKVPPLPFLMHSFDQKAGMVIFSTDGLLSATVFNCFFAIFAKIQCLDCTVLPRNQWAHSGLRSLCRVTTRGLSLKAQCKNAPRTKEDWSDFCLFWLLNIRVNKFMFDVVIVNMGSFSPSCPTAYLFASSEFFISSQILDESQCDVYTICLI